MGGRLSIATSAEICTASYLASLPASERQAFLESLTPSEELELYYHWPFWARPSQLPPEGAWFVWFLLAGRGFGKTRTGAEFVRARVESGRFERIALIGQTAADVRDVMVEGESGLIAVSPPWNKPKYEPSKRRLTWPNGAIATTYSGDEPDQLRGPQHDTAWCDELAKWQYAQLAWDNLEMGLRLGPNPQAVVTTTPRPIPLIRALLKDPMTRVQRGKTNENMGNLPPAFIERVINKYQGTRLGRQELDAEILEDNPDALWQRSTIEAARVVTAPPLRRVVVAIDPSVTSQGDEAGIMTAGVARCSCKGSPEDHAFVLSDDSLQASPERWASAAVTAYGKFKADRLIAEDNNGGEMIEIIIRSIAGAPPVKRIHASRGKQTRAEPISMLYEQGKVHHVGTFPKLEDELCSWTQGDASPNRLDALVWALTELMLNRAEVRIWE